MRRIVRSSDGSIAKNIRMVCFLGAKPSDIWLIKGWLHGWCRYLSRFLMVTWMMGNYAVTGPTHIWNHLNATSTQSVSLAEPFLRFFLALQPWNGVLNTSTPSFRPEVLVFVYIGRWYIYNYIYIIGYITKSCKFSMSFFDPWRETCTDEFATIPLIALGNFHVLSDFRLCLASDVHQTRLGALGFLGALQLLRTSVLTLDLNDPKNMFGEIRIVTQFCYDITDVWFIMIMDKL